MCGIAGILLNNSNKKLIEKFQKISGQLLHRGPDSSSFYRNSKNFFLHTRLSIIDLKGGKQPIINNDLILVANGEIYNDPEIRWQRKGSDTSGIVSALFHFQRRCT